MRNPSDKDTPRELTGRFVLFVFIGFFGVVFAVNAVMAYFATSTFGGVETASSYKAGLAFRQEQQSAHAQDARGWRVRAAIDRKISDAVVLDAWVEVPNGQTPRELTALARLVHPADARRDHALELTEISNGHYRGTSDAEPGQWDLIIDVMQENERVFRSKSRIMLK